MYEELNDIVRNIDREHGDSKQNMLKPRTKYYSLNQYQDYTNQDICQFIFHSRR